MRLEPGTRGLTVLLALMTGLGPLSTDIYLASMPFIGAALNASSGEVQLTLSAYLEGFALGQILYGPLSDKYGRRPALLAGFALYLVATLACIAAGSIELLIAARVVQAFGAAGPIILARAVVRDLYEGARAGRQLSIMSTIQGFTPIGAPVLGGVLQSLFDWHASFVAMGLMGGALALAVLLLLPETNRHRHDGPISPATILASFGIILKNPAYRSYLLMQAFSYNGLFAFLSASSYVLQKVYGFNSVQFGLMFALCSSSFVSGTFLGARLVARRGLDRMIGLGANFLLVGGLGQLVTALLIPQSVLGLVIPQMIYFLGFGFMLPNMIAAAMSPFPERAGAASSLMGFVQMTSAAIVGWIMGASLGGTAMPLVIVMAVAGIGSFALFHLTRHHRPPPVLSGRL